MIKAGHRNSLIIGMLALSPLAYIGSLLIERALPPRLDVSSIPQADAIRIARDFATSRGIDTGGWQSAVATQSSGDLVPVFRRNPGPLTSITSPSTLRVMLQDSNKNRSLRVDLTPHGRVIAFQESKIKHDLAPADRETARAAAESFLRGWLGSNTSFDLQYRKPSTADDQDQDRSFTFRSKVEGVPKVTAVFHVDVYGTRIVGYRCGVTAESSYYTPYNGWLSGLEAVAWIYLIAVGIYAIVRFFQLAGDKEVSLERSALAALAFALMSALFVFDPGYLAAQIGPEVGISRVAILCIMVVSYCVAGAFFGVAYGAGEGALRKGYPGKLTSLDALLSAKLFSTNVARSILIGGGIAGWLLLLQNGLLLAVHGYRVGSDHEILASSFQRFPLLVLLGNRINDAVLQTSFGLLLPLSLLLPRIRKQWLFYILLPLFAMLPATITAGDEALWSTFVSLQLVLVAAVLLPFYTGDLLATICCIFAVRFVGGLIERGAVSASWEHVFLWNVAPAGLVFLATQVYFAFRGPTYEEYEVRPRYAHFLVEHEAMEAEIDAARLAQLRLLPSGPPAVEGLSIAASCVAAREVGGDFFDFYELDSHRVGVFLAEGGSRELGSAMPIALAKGYLLYASCLDLPPAELLRRIYGVMDATLAGHAAMSMLYAVIDGRARTIRFARTGDSPRLSINGVSAVEELAGDSSGPKIHHGVATLLRKDAIFLYTDGLAAQIAERKRQWTDAFLRKLVARHPESPAADLLAEILKAAIRGKQHPPDDVTSVVIRVEEPAVNAMGVVA